MSDQGQTEMTNLAIRELLDEQLHIARVTNVGVILIAGELAILIFVLLAVLHG